MFSIDMRDYRINAALSLVIATLIGLSGCQSSPMAINQSGESEETEQIEEISENGEGSKDKSEQKQKLKKKKKDSQQDRKNSLKQKQKGKSSAAQSDELFKQKDKSVSKLKQKSKQKKAEKAKVDDELKQEENDEDLEDNEKDHDQDSKLDDYTIDDDDDDDDEDEDEDDNDDEDFSDDADDRKQSKSKKNSGKQKRKARGAAVKDFENFCQYDEGQSIYAGYDLLNKSSDYLREIEIGDFTIEIIDPDILSSEDINEVMSEVISRIEELSAGSESEAAFRDSTDFISEVEAFDEYLCYSLKRYTMDYMVYEALFTVNVYSGKILDIEDICEYTGIAEDNFYEQLEVLLKAASDNDIAVRESFGSFFDNEFVDLYHRYLADLKDYLEGPFSVFNVRPSAKDNEILLINKNDGPTASMPDFLFNISDLRICPDLSETLLVNKWDKSSIEGPLYIMQYDDLSEISGLNVIDEIEFTDQTGEADDIVSRVLVAKTNVEIKSIEAGYYENELNYEEAIENYTNSFRATETLTRDIVMQKGEAIMIKGPVGFESQIKLTAEYQTKYEGRKNIEDPLLMHNRLCRYDDEDLKARYID